MGDFSKTVRKRPLRLRAEALIPAWGPAIVGAAAGGGITTGMRGNMADFGGIGGEQLKSLIECIERLEEEKRALGEDIKEIYAEAKGSGLEPKIMPTTDQDPQNGQGRA